LGRLVMQIDPVVQSLQYLGPETWISIEPIEKTFPICRIIIKFVGELLAEFSGIAKILEKKFPKVGVAVQAGEDLLSKGRIVIETVENRSIECAARCIVSGLGLDICLGLLRNARVCGGVLGQSCGQNEIAG